MWNFLKSKARKRQEAIIANIRTFAAMEQFASKGLILWNEEKNTVFISSIIIRPYETSDKMVRNFLTAVANWLAYHHSQLTWETEWFKAEHAAVLEAKKANPNLTDTQIAQIRQEAREKVEYDEDKFKKVDTFSFVVFSDAVLSDNSKLITVGRYDKGEIALNPTSNVGG